MKIYFSTTALEFQTQTAGQINGVNTTLTFSLKNRNFVGIYSTYAEAVRETAAELEGGGGRVQHMTRW